MTKEQSVILALIRKAVNPTVEISIPVDVDWGKVIEEATDQGVLGLCFNAVESLPEEQRPDIDNLMEWLGQVNYMEATYDQYKISISHLSDFYARNGIKTLLLKGYGCSLSWPKPNHRPTGDIDVYLYGDWKKADELLYKQYGIKADDGHEHHTTFTFDDFMVENHYDIVDTSTNESSRELDKVYKKMAEEAIHANIENTQIYLPSNDFNALYLIRHIGGHFAGGRATLRQILDWGLFMQKNSKAVIWGQVVRRYKEAGIFTFVQQINAICVDYLGFNEFKGWQTYKDYDIDKNLEKRIFEDILSPEYGEVDHTKGKLNVICQKTRRFFANGWKRKLVYRESIWSQFLYGSMSHLHRFNTIKD